MKTKLRVIFAAPVGVWGRTLGQAEREEEISRFKERFSPIKSSFPNVDFVEEDLASESDFEKLEEGRGEDGILFFNLGRGADDVISDLMDRGLPMILFVEPYSWHVWCRDVLRSHENSDRLMLVSSSDLNEISRRIRVIDAYRRIKETKILLFEEWGDDRVKLIYGAESVGDYSIHDLEDKFGVRIERLDKEVILEAYAGVGDEDAEELAESILDQAEWIVEPSREDVYKSCKLYLAMKKVVEDREANAITEDCLALLRVMPAMPCLGFSLLNDEGICAACEADLNSLLTMLVFRYLAEVPSFITDPVIDTATNSVIHAHCVAPTKMDGRNRERFVLRNHSGSRMSVSLQVKMKVGQEVTVAKFADLDRMLISTGTITGNPDLERACRTKVEVSVKDASRMLDNFSGGLHRVLAYGNHVREIEDLCRLLGVEVVHE